jgi:hypothetical protein
LLENRKLERKLIQDYEKRISLVLQKVNCTNGTAANGTDADLSAETGRRLTSGKKAFVSPLLDT